MLRHVSFLGRLVDVAKAIPEGSIRDLEIRSSLFDIYLNAIALFMNKAAAVLLE